MAGVATDRSVRSLLKQGIGQLREANVPSFTLAAELLLLHVAARDRTWLYAHPEEILSAEITTQYFALIQRRANGEPTQHLTGKQEFWGLEFEVTPDVLIPRPETEHLIEVALDRLALRGLHAGRSPRLTGNGITLVDVGTGSGCIAIALAKELPNATIYATDISAAALDVARRNATRLGVSNRIQFLESNLLEAFIESRATDHESRLFDLIVCNPPYIGHRDADSLPREVRDHEPPAALFAGEQGYELYGALIPQAARHLKPGGLLVLELGYNSLPAVQPLLDPSHWTDVGVTNDLAGIPRVLAAERVRSSNWHLEALSVKAV
ncbi:MAG TPA: peptide chain release factor N(5)-glutamine methyltransferase [Candidatus Acidoferrum sp.]|nr:peptide chain release factor N(5)-glutamine methyltransferase [Candidatus Acidoferrum sp.]